MIRKGLFLGAATAAKRIEGTVKKDGRGKSIWDTFSGSGSLEQDSPISFLSMEKEEQTCGRSITTDFESIFRLSRL